MTEANTVPARTRIRLAAGLALGLAMLGGIGAAPRAWAVEAPVARAADWAARAHPSPGPAHAIGGTALGCLAGGVALGREGPGWQAINISRNRQWGHPETVTLVRRLASQARAAGLPDLYIGDLAQPRGGPMPSDHASHQSGLDVDIWLDLRPKPPLPESRRDGLAIASLVRPDGEDIDPSRWTTRHATLIRLAAEQPGLDRLLVNPAIKRRLCAAHRGEAWLRRVRPWRGHDSHMHIRLRCPAGSPDCRDLVPPPPGDGCDASLDWWFSEDARHPRPRIYRPGPPPRLPLACAGVLRAR